nr:hypothetical protein [Myxococcota bacterium]
RFNLACARARLGSLDEARRELRALLCEDLPSNAPRATSDPDLEPLRAELTTLVAAIAAQYTAAAAGRASLVAGGSHVVEHRLAWVWAQPGIWSHDTGRFVPMGPRVRESSRPAPYWPIVAAHFDADRMRSLFVTLQGNDAEGDLPVDRVHVRTYAAPTGESELDVRPALGESYGFTAALGSDGDVRVGLPGWQGGPRPTVRSVSATGTRAERRGIEGTRLGIGAVSWHPETPAPGFELARAVLRTPGGEHTLDAAHRRLADHTVRVSADAGVAFAISSQSGDCGYADQFVIDRIELATGAIARMAEGEGQPILEVGRDGAVYLQVGDVLRRWASVRSAPAESETLPVGLGLSTQPSHFNPYC